MEWYFDNKVEDLVVPEDSESEFDFDEGANFYSSIDMSSKSNNSYNNAASLLWNHQPDFSHEINHMDDIFFNSLFENDPSNDTILDDIANIWSQNDGTSKYLKTHPSTDCDDTLLSTTYQIQKQYTRNEKSMEESVLNDLERVTALLSDKTRICFRDAFNRLAKSSKQSFMNPCLEGEPVMTSNDDALMAQETEAENCETNIIDRAIGSLMFSKFEFEENGDQKVVSICQNQRYYDDDDAIVPQWGM